MLGINYYTTGRISAKTCPEIQQRREKKGVWSERPSTSEGGGEFVGRQCRKASANLGGTIQSHRHHGRKGILFGRFG